MSIDRSAVLKWLQANVPKARIQHILRVETYAQELAAQHALDVDKSAQAALLHDLAKYFKPEKLLSIAQAEGISIDLVLAANPRLLHAEVGAIVARDQFQVEDPEILDGIRNHTLGQPQMSPLSCVIFLADSLEPGRGDQAELKQLRKVCASNLYQGVWLTCDFTMSRLIQNRKLIHPRMIMTRNWALQADSSVKQRKEIKISAPRGKTARTIGG